MLTRTKSGLIRLGKFWNIKSWASKLKERVWVSYQNEQQGSGRDIAVDESYTLYPGFSFISKHEFEMCLVPKASVVPALSPSESGWRGLKRAEQLGTCRASPAPHGGRRPAAWLTWREHKAQRVGHVLTTAPLSVGATSFLMFLAMWRSQSI